MPATALVLAFSAAAAFRIWQLDGAALLPLAAFALPIGGLMVGALLLCHALAVAKFEQRRAPT